MPLISDNILEETRYDTPAFDEVYPRYESFNLASPAAFLNGHPFEHYEILRKNAPISWTPMPRKTRGFWSVTRYEDIKTVELNPQIFSSQRGSINMALPPKHLRFPKKLMPAALNSLINFDAPHHMEMRLQQKNFFIPRYVATLEDKISKHVDSLLDEMEAQGPIVDFVKLFSERLPLFTLCEMLGVEHEDRPKIIRWMHYLEMAQQVVSSPWGTFKSDPMFIPRYIKNVSEMFAFGERIMADRHANPKDDLLTAIAESELNGERLPQEYLDGSWLLIIFAGNDTTRNSLSGTLRLLTEFNNEKQKLIEEPSLIRPMLQEALRMVSPVVHMRRTTTEETELAGQRIAENEKVVMWYAAANRDPDVFENPDQFDISRSNAAKHLAFGHGPHKCLGSRIALLQLRIAYEKILDRFPNIKWTGKQTMAPNNFVHAISSLNVDLGTG